MFWYKTACCLPLGEGKYQNFHKIRRVKTKELLKSPVEKAEKREKVKFMSPSFVNKAFKRNHLEMFVEVTSKAIGKALFLIYTLK